MAQQDDLSSRFGSSAARAVHESGDERSARPDERSARTDERSARTPESAGAEHDAKTTALRDSCAAREKVGNRTEHSVRAENAAKVLRPIRNTRVEVSTELDEAMTVLGFTNEQVARVLGVTEKTVREWRGRTALLPGEAPKAISYCAVLELPDRLREKMLSLATDKEAERRQAARRARAIGA